MNCVTAGERVTCTWSLDQPLAQDGTAPLAADSGATSTALAEAAPVTVFGWRPVQVTTPAAAHLVAEKAPPSEVPEVPSPVTASLAAAERAVIDANAAPPPPRQPQRR